MADFIAILNIAASPGFSYNNNDHLGLAFYHLFTEAKKGTCLDESQNTDKLTTEYNRINY